MSISKYIFNLFLFYATVYFSVTNEVMKISFPDLGGAIKHSASLGTLRLPYIYLQSLLKFGQSLSYDSSTIMYIKQRG